MILIAVRVASVLPRRAMPSSWLLVLMAYYLVGILIFVRDLRTTSEDSRVMRQFNEELKRMSNLELVWDSTKLLLFVVFIHIPCWIFRV